jgi:HPt (histidine-containing phosphotransfer) domain-containing protein
MMPKESLLELFSACIADTRSCIRDLQHLIQHGSGKEESVRPLAHRIKGAASMVGAIRLARLAAGLEAGGSKEAATPGVLDDLLTACAELERMLLAGNLTKT